MQKISDNLNRLKKYFEKILHFKEVPKAELLSGNEALKNFGKIWNENAKWFFSLFKSSFINYFHGLSVKNTEKMDNEICIDVEENYEEFISIYAINR